MLEKFLRERQDLSAGRKQYYRAVFKKVAELVPKPYGLDREGIAGLAEKLSLVLKPGAYNTYMHAIRCVYKWMGKADAVVFIKFKPVKREDYVRKEILSSQEVHALLRATDKPRDRAVIAVLIATGVRRGELAGMKLRDIEALPYGFRILVSGKTGTHKTPPITREFAKILNVWLDHHPQRDNPDASLWIGRDGHGVNGFRLHRIVKRSAKLAGLKRNVHLHMFRHTENTWSTARGVSRATRNKTHGWSERGNTAAIYENITDGDAEEEYLRVQGIKKVTVKPDEFGLKVCMYCGEENPESAKYCSRCNVPLDAEEAEKALANVVSPEDRDLLNWLKNSDVRKGLEKLLK
jgi:integrase/recombinase XerD